MIFFNLLSFADVVQLKAPGVGPDAAEHLKVLEQICSHLHIHSVPRGTHSWKNKHNSNVHNSIFLEL